MARAGLRKGHEDSSESPSASREVLPERMNQARWWAYHDGFHEESHGIGPTPIICRTAAASVKATRRIPAFPHDGQHIGLSATSRGWRSTARPREMKIKRVASV